MIPSWAPNLHPMVVHFPVAILCVAVLFDVLALFWRRRWAPLTLALYVIGTVSLVAGYVSGRAAADSVMVSGQANVVLTTHADWALAALWVFGVYTALRLLLAWKTTWSGQRLVHVPLVLAAAAGLFVMFQAAEHGARMVYEYGVGVQAADSAAVQLERSRRELARLQGQAELPVIQDDGSWQWAPGPHAQEAFEQGLVPLAGRIEAAAVADTAAALTAVESPALYVLLQYFESVQIDAELGLEGFDGSVQLVYNVVGPMDYHFTELAEGRVRQGVVDQGVSTVLDDQPFAPSRWETIRVVSDRTHFRAYAGTVMIAHSHGATPDAGSAGLRIDGTGTVLVGRLEALRLR